MPTQQKVIQVNYESQTGWPYPLVNAIQAHPNSSALMQLYRSVRIGDRLISLSTKIVTLGLATHRLNQSLQLINEDIAKRLEYVVECFRNGYAYACKDRMLAFQLVLDVETFIFEARSSFDMLIEFAELLYNTYSVFPTSINKQNIALILAESGRPADWIATLKSIRDMGIHERAPWVGIEKLADDQSYSPVLVFDDTHNAPASEACYSIKTLNSIGKGMSDLFDFIMNKTVSRLKEGVS